MLELSDCESVLKELALLPDGDGRHLRDDLDPAGIGDGEQAAWAERNDRARRLRPAAHRERRDEGESGSADRWGKAWPATGRTREALVKYLLTRGGAVGAWAFPVRFLERDKIAHTACAGRGHRHAARSCDEQHPHLGRRHELGDARSDQLRVRRLAAVRVRSLR